MVSKFGLYVLAVMALAAVSASSVSRDYCTSTSYCNDGYHCCSDYQHCCPNEWSCCFDNLRCCKYSAENAVQSFISSVSAQKV